MLSQHIGAICEPIVAKKDKVVAGQKIGQSDAFVSAPVHSPINGTVKEISLHGHPILGRTMGIVIEADEDNALAEPGAGNFKADFDETAYSSEQICEAIGEAGIVGMGGAGFPTKVKLLPNPAQPKNILIINGCECEPFITCDNRIMLEWGCKVLAGIKLARRACGCETVRIGIEKNKPQAIKAMTEILNSSSNSKDIEIVPLKTKYPQGGERQLIKAVSGQTVPTGGIPPMIGVVVLNISTAVAIAEAVTEGKPLMRRVVTVTGGGIVKGGNFYVPIGISVAELIEHCGGLTQQGSKVIMGGPMMGLAIADLSTPLTKTSNAITVLTKKEIGKAKFDRRQTACIRCGRCLTVCPEHLNPTKIAHAARHNLLDVAQNYYMAACMECGSCSYICPANIELSGYIKTGKILLAREKKRMPE